MRFGRLTMTVLFTVISFAATPTFAKEAEYGQSQNSPTGKHVLSKHCGGFDNVC